MTSKKSRLGKVLAPWVVLILLLSVSDPTKLPAAILIVPFVLLFIAIYVTAVALMRALRDEEQGKVVGMKASRPRLIAALVACVPVLLLTLQSIGQLTLWDVLTVAVLFIISYFYIVKSSVAFPGR